MEMIQGKEVFKNKTQSSPFPARSRGSSGAMSSLLLESAPAPQPRAAGPSSATLEVEIGGRPTKLMLSAYSNRILAIVTQRENLGTLIHAFREDAVDAAGPGCYGTRVLLGRRDEETLEVRV